MTSFNFEPLALPAPSAGLRREVREFLREAVGDPMGMRFFNYGLPAADQPLAATNYATGFKPVGPASMYLHHILGDDMQLAVDMTNDPRFMDTICPEMI